MGRGLLLLGGGRKKNVRVGFILGPFFQPLIIIIYIATSTENKHDITSLFDNYN